MKSVLTIAGSDCSGGAGIQADLKTMLANGVYGMSVITSLTAQNTTGVRSISNAEPLFLADQIDSVFEDIVPDAVKTGMIPSKELVEVTADKLKTYGVKNLVVDPVMVATSGARLIEEDAVETLKTSLLPLATIITPNIPEAEILTGMTIKDEDSMEEAARELYSRYGCAALVKGGHSINDANDVLYSADNKEPVWFKGQRIENPNTHGTGCTLSSAIASNLAKGCSLKESVERAKDYLSGALAAMLDLGRGSGPLAHNYLLMKGE